ncbi:hypothetical protein [Mesorhizobium sp.]|uniref:hypothetical protein n=1 Tax=Mesorhizobium sp. TaxID=1871066 RepID=UPI0025BEAF28|nr:hypothetical protein [Mesorhizobium sp.]
MSEHDVNPQTAQSAGNTPPWNETVSFQNVMVVEVGEFRVCDARGVREIKNTLAVSGEIDQALPVADARWRVHKERLDNGEADEVEYPVVDREKN